MIWLLLSLVLLGILAFLFGKMARFRKPASPASADAADAEADADAAKAEAARPEGCCGQHAVCEKDSLLAAVSRDVEYFDDEELDRFRGRPAYDYAPEEVEEFEEVLTTMHPDEVPAWVRSLQLRGIELPDSLRDDVILLVGEQRDAHAAS